MMSGLVSDGRQTPGVTSVGTGSPEMTTTGQDVESHLDSFFNRSGWTREDVLVIAASVQIAMWVALLYLEVTE